MYFNLCFKVKRHSSTRIPSSSSQKCTYGQCNGHTKTELNNKSVSMYSNSPSSSLLSAVSNPSSSVRGGDCIECSQQQSILSRKLELENIKTKNKMDQLRLVMQQKRERREARKLNATPYSVPKQHSPAITIAVTPISAPISSPVIMKATKLIESTVVNQSTSSTNLIANTTVSAATEHEIQNTEVDATSSATATAIATSIAAQTNSEIENHMEEVDTVA